MKTCEHSAWIHYGPVRVCLRCGEQRVVHTRQSTWSPQWTCDPTFRKEDVERMIEPTPRDEVDAFVATLKGVAR